MPNVIITGGSGGIGTALSQFLARKGWGIANFDIAEPTTGNGGVWFNVDVTKSADISDGIKAAESKIGPIEAMVCLAGVVEDGAIVGLAPGALKIYSEHDWSKTLAVNLTGTFLCARAFAETKIRTRSPATIVTCSSPAAVGAKGQGAYAASKAGIEALTRTMALELRPHSIRVCGLRPALTKTPMAEKYSEQILKSISERSILGRFALPDEVAEGFYFLLNNPTLQGRVFSFDGGLDL